MFWTPHTGHWEDACVDGADESGWSAVAQEWSELWGTLADPVTSAIIEQTGVVAGTRVLDVGCGSGEFLAKLERLGARVTGIDPAHQMVRLARAAAPTAEVVIGGFENLPWSDASFDVVTAINALQFADDPHDALAQAARVCVPGGFIAIANWAEGALNALDVLESAVAEAAGEELQPDGDYRRAGGLEALLAEAGLTVIAASLVETPWEVADDSALIRGVLLGEDQGTIIEYAPTVLAAAEQFRTPDGGYRLVNAFRYAIARTPG